jgi:hypothetical protein
MTRFPKMFQKSADFFTFQPPKQFFRRNIAVTKPRGRGDYSVRFRGAGKQVNRQFHDRNIRE